MTKLTRVGAALSFSLFALSACAPKPAGPDFGAPRGARLEREAAEQARERIAADKEARLKDAPVRGAILPDWKPLPLDPPEFDALHYRLALGFPAECVRGAAAFNGHLELSLRPARENTRVLELDAEDLEIRSVTLLNTFTQLPFEARDSKLAVNLGQAYGPSDTLTLAIDYAWRGDASSGDRGVYFRSRHGVGTVESIYSQSEPELAKYWFPGNARPNDRATFESLVTVPEPFKALSNGALVSERADASGMRTFHWSMAMPMPSYLFVITAGRYEVERLRWRDTPVEYWSYPDDMERARFALRNTPEMMEFFSVRTGFAYPYEKYAQIVVPQYMWGGMEHTTATTLTDRTLHGPAEADAWSSDSLVAHELAHQWFGDLVTSKSWDHLWLNEGFATYFDALYQEKSRGRAALLEEMDGSAAWYYSEEDVDARPVVFAHFRDSLDDYFDSHAYGKGSWVLHMLRGLVGDGPFFAGIRRYLHQHAATLVETADFRRAMERASGRDLGWFFDQWVMRPGYPKFRVSWTHADGVARLSVAQAQDTDLPGGLPGTTPLFRGPIGVELDGETVTLELSGAREQLFELPRAEAPRYVRFNAEGGWLARVETEQDEAAWLAQLSRSKDVTARIEAARWLAAPDSDDDEEEDARVAVADLGRRVKALLACGQKDASLWARESCLQSLAGWLEPTDAHGLQGRLKVLATEAPPRVRAAALAALAKYGDRAAETLADAADSELDLRARVAAVAALGRVGGETAYAALQRALAQPSFQERLRSAALSALGKLKDLRSLASGEEFARAQYEEGLRQGAFTLLVQLGRAHRPAAGDRARLAIEGALADVSYRTRRAAIAALKELGDRAAIPALRRVAESDPDDRLRTAARKAVAELESGE